MAVITNTFLTFAAVGNREDLADTIYNISPTDTPFQANVGKTKAEATLHEWQTDVLAAAATNSHIQGDDTTSTFTWDTVSATVRLGNRTQISRKDVVVSGTQDAVNKAGRKKEIVYQLVKKSKELNRDMEFNLLGNYAIQIGGTSTAPTYGAVPTWAGSTTSNNISQGTSGTCQGLGLIRTTGTTRGLTESILKSTIQQAWTNGGDIDLIIAGPFNKTVISGFTGNSTRIQDTSEDQKLVAAIDVYESDFGTHKIVADRFTDTTQVLCLMTDMWAVAYLRPKQTIDLAKTGDNEKGMILAEYTLESRNDSGTGFIFDLTTS